MSLSPLAAPRLARKPAPASESACRRCFLFLQGPPGPFFRLLGSALHERGAEVMRINLSGGDKRDWPEASHDYRGRMANWPLFFDRFVTTHAVTDLVLFGDCRPVHTRALRLARLRGVRVHVFEEGYIRPDWMTLEREGVNGFSRFERDADKLLELARALPPLPDLPPVTAAFARRAHDSYWHYHAVVTGRLSLRFPFYSSHRQGSILLEGLGWAWRLARERVRLRPKAGDRPDLTGGRPYFLFPLQLSGDYQIRAHSPFSTMVMALEYVLASFARHAPPDAMLMVKEHPLEAGWRDWRRTLARRAARHGLTGRVIHVAQAQIDTLCGNSRGVVCVNSTCGTLALAAGVPVIVLGEAVYDVPGITHQGPLDGFWTDPARPDMVLWHAFRRVLVERCLVRGGIGSESATRELVASSLARLLPATPARRSRKEAATGTQTHRNGAPASLRA